MKINPDAERQIAAMAQKAFKRFEGDLNHRRSRLQGRPVAEVRCAVDSVLRKYGLDLPDATVASLVEGLAEGRQIQISTR
ncbi:hypothetical protein [Actinomyces naeslundii]|uniref:Uncharacterized protein n=1 Tax=Actinomyces naeslundii TaxID=1655 RepID=A0AA47FHS4_ACTNA|nr:hypothetical protein [Actinomyces naeslundii]PKY95036.1 hypothetical protein CYJ18_09510 [Actinomyces naeslundii]WAL42621.1 hypothetical protein OFA60_11340 [Actinomyces naeslundii]